MPRHLLEEAYRTDKQSMIHSPLLSSGFVGLGPYRIARWDDGVELQFDRFDGYYLGRPPLDTVVVRYIKDGNTMVANILSGTVDVVVPPEHRPGGSGRHSDAVGGHGQPGGGAGDPTRPLGATPVPAGVRGGQERAHEPDGAQSVLPRRRSQHAG